MKTQGKKMIFSKQAFKKFYEEQAKEIGDLDINCLTCPPFWFYAKDKLVCPLSIASKVQMQRKIFDDRGMVIVFERGKDSYGPYTRAFCLDTQGLSKEKIDQVNTIHLIYGRKFLGSKN